MTTNDDRNDDETNAGAGGLVPASGVGGELDVIASQLVDAARAEGIALTGEGGLLPALLGRVLSAGLPAELTDHLGYERHAVDGHGSGNSRNGTYPKTVTTEIGEVEVAMPRDRAGSFDPVLVPKGERRLDGLAGQVISLYAKGLTTGEIRSHLEEIYDTSISKDTISRITDAIVADMEAWQSRPLDPIYAVVLIDAIVVKVRDTQVANRPVYVAIGVNLDGERDVLGLWMGPTGGEGAKQWMTMLTELRNRGVTDVLITCCDGLTGLPDAVRTVWPDTTVQTCVVHLVRNSLRYASKKYWPQITRSLKAIYTAPTVPAAEDAFETFADEWRELYPAMIASWESSVGRVRALPRVPGRAPHHRVHDQLDRVAQRPLPASGPPPRPLPDRAGRHEGPLPQSHRTQDQPIEHDRPNQRLEDHPQRPHHPLR